MENNPNLKLLRIFIGESDQHQGKPLYKTLVFEAKKQGLFGATVLRGIMGFGANSQVQSNKLFEISSDLPLIVEIVDEEQKIRDFVRYVKSLFEEAQSGGLITLEKAEVMYYRAVKK
jgi:PII-like signaling protein